MSHTDTRPRLDEQHPYPGLISFDEEDAPFFRGRAQAVEELLTRVELRPLTVLYGRSGLGKTSLLQAGLFPRLRRVGLVPVRIRLVFAGDAQGRRQPPLAAQVKHCVRDAIERGDLDGAPPADDEPLCEYFRSAGFWDADGRPAIAVLVLDQFEEIFTLGRDRRDEVRDLMIELSDLVENRAPQSRPHQPHASQEVPRAKVLLSLREDALADLDEHKRLMPSLGTGRFRLLPLDGRAALEAVRDPGHAIMDEDVAWSIVCTVAGVPETARPEDINEVDPALLALYCRELSEKRGEEPRISRKLLEKSERILDDFYKGCVEGMPEAVRDLLEEELLTEDGHRDTIAESRLGALGVITDNVDRLIEKRLLRRERRMGQIYVEIVHDVLTKTIRQRRDERRGERAERKRQEEEAAAQRQAVEALKRQAEEAEAQRKAEVERRELSEELARAQRRSARVTIGLLIVAVIGVVLYFGLQKAQERRHRVGSAKIRMDSEVLLAEKLSEPAWRATAERRWEDAARMLGPAFEALVEAREQKLIADPGGQLTLPGSPLQAILGCRFEATAGSVVPLFTDTAGVSTFRVTRDGRYGAVLGADGRSVTLIDLDSHRRWPADPPAKAPTPRENAPLEEQLVQSIEWFAGSLRQLVPSGDGALLFGSGDRGQVVVWEIASGTRRLGFRVGQDLELQSVDRSGARALFLSPGGQALVVDIDAAKREIKARKLEGAARDDDARRAPARSPDGSQHPWGWLSLSLTPDGKHVIGVRSPITLGIKADPAVARWSELVVWDASSNEEPRVVQVDAVEQAVLSPDGALLAALLHDGTIEVREVAGGRIKDAVRWKPPAPVSSIELAPDGGALLVRTERTLSRWSSLEKGNPTEDWQLPLVVASRAVRLSSDGAQVVVLASDEARLYDTKSRSLRSVMPLPEVRRSIFGRRAQVEIRVRGARLEVLTASGDALRARSFGDGDGESRVCKDRILANAGAKASPSRSESIPLSGFVASVAADADRLAILAWNNAWIVSGFKEQAGDGGSSKLDIREWKPGRALRALKLAGNHIVAMDEAGTAYIGDPGGSVRTTRQSVFPTGELRDQALLALSEGGEWAATASSGPSVYCWNTTSGQLEWEGDVRLEHSAASRKRIIASAPVTALAVANVKGGGGVPDRCRVIVGDERGAIRALTSREREREVVWTAVRFEESPHRDAVETLEIGPDERVASGAVDGTVALWSLGSRPVASAKDLPRHDGPVRALRFSRDGELLVSGGADRRVHTWKIAGGAPGCTMREHTAAITAIAVDRGSGRRVISLDEDGKAILWNLDDCVSIGDFHGVVHAGFIGTTGQIVTVTPSGIVEVWAGGAWATGTNPSGDTVWGLIGGRTLYAGDDAGAVVRRDLEGGGAPEGIGKLRLDREWSVRAAALSPDGMKLLSVEEGPGAKLRGRLLAPPAWTEAAPAVELKYDAGACGASDQEGEPGSTAERIFAASWTDKGPRVAGVDGKGCVRIWGDDGVPQVVVMVPGSSAEFGKRTTAVAASPDLLRLMLGSEDGAVSIWERQTEPGLPPLRLIERKRLHDDRVRAIAFHPEGRFAVTAGEDGQAWLWDAKDAHPVAPLGSHPAPIRWAAFRPDGAEVVTGGADGWIQAWATRTLVDDPRRLVDTLKPWLPKPAK